MHKQLKHTGWSAEKMTVLLFVFLLSIILMVIALYFFVTQNIQPVHQQGHLGYSLACISIAIFLTIYVVVALLREMGDQKEINNELVIQKDYYRFTINSIHEGLITTGKKGEILYMNPSAEKLTGWSNAEARDLPLEKVYEVINEESGKSLEHIVSRILRKGQKVQFENNISLNTKSGCRKSISNSGSPLFDAAGNISGAVLLFTDVSEKKENEKQLRESESFSRGILDALNSHIAVINEAGTIVKVNKAWKKFALYNPAINLENYDEGANYFPICKNFGNVQDGTGLKILEGIQKVFAASLDEFYLEYAKQNAIDEKWFSVRVMKFESAEPLVVVEHADITERKKSEEKTLKAIEQYDILSQATSDTIWDWDILLNQITYNEGITKMFGYKIAEVNNAVDWWQKNIHPDDLQRVTAALGELFKNGMQNLQLEYRFRSADGAFKYIYDRAFVLYDAKGGPTRIIGAMQDVTYEKEEEKRIAKTVIEAQEKERLYIGQELHDNINQILAGSLLTIAMAKQKQDEPEKMLQMINLSEEHLAHAIDEVRKLSHKLVPVFFEETTLQNIFEDLLSKININNQFSIAFSFDEKINLVASDDIQINLYRILQEQVKNILTYSAANLIEVSVSLSKNALRMRTFDNGRGFDPETIKKGIGLSNIKKRVDSFKGKFIMNTAPFQGCEMIIEIPVEGA